MKKNKLIISILIIFIILWLLVFAVDYTRCSNLKMPIFVVAEQTMDDSGSGMYYGIGYKVKVEKYISTEFGEIIASVEMYFFNQLVVVSIA